MTPNERTLIPPPECCRTCAHCQTMQSCGVARHECLNGHPMHPSCGWFVARTVSMIELGAVK